MQQPLLRFWESRHHKSPPSHHSPSNLQSLLYLVISCHLTSSHIQHLLGEHHAASALSTGIRPHCAVFLLSAHSNAHSNAKCPSDSDRSGSTPQCRNGIITSRSVFGCYGLSFRRISRRLCLSQIHL